MTLKNERYLELMSAMPADGYLPGAHAFLLASRDTGPKTSNIFMNVNRACSSIGPMMPQ